MNNNPGMPTSVSNLVDSIHKFGLDTKTREVHLHGAYTGMVDEDMAVEFLKNMRVLEGDSSEGITIHVMTVGGDYSYGMAVHDIIKLSKCHITTISYGGACSMGGIIPQAADHRVIMPSCRFLAHYGFDGYIGVANAMQSAAEENKIFMKTVEDTLVNSAVNGAKFKGWTEKRVRTYITQKLTTKVDWWLSADEAVEHGFMDEVLR